MIKVILMLLILLAFSAGWVLCKTFSGARWDSLDRALCFVVIGSVIAIQVLLP